MAEMLFRDDLPQRGRRRRRLERARRAGSAETMVIAAAELAGSATKPARMLGYAPSCTLLSMAREFSIR
jgi:hypothetical protein